MMTKKKFRQSYLRRKRVLENSSSLELSIADDVAERRPQIELLVFGRHCCYRGSARVPRWQLPT